jgi:hypothetical protein
MPTKKTAAVPSQPSGETVPAFAAPAPSFSAAQVVFAGSRSAWNYMAHPGRLNCSAGEIVPSLAKAWHTPGVNGNDRNPNAQGAGFVAAMQPKGWIMVPHTIECSAWGASRVGSPYSTYLDRYEDSLGHVVWSDAWHRPRSLGEGVEWDFDAEGWLDFLIRVRNQILGTLDRHQIERATLPLINAARLLADREDRRSKRLLQLHLVQLPEQHLPPDLAELRVG